MWLSIHASPLNASNLDGPIQSGRDVSELRLIARGDRVASPMIDETKAGAQLRIPAKGTSRR